MTLCPSLWRLPSAASHFSVNLLWLSLLRLRKILSSQRRPLLEEQGPPLAWPEDYMPAISRWTSLKISSDRCSLRQMVPLIFPTAQILWLTSVCSCPGFWTIWSRRTGAAASWPRDTAVQGLWFYPSTIFDTSSSSSSSYTVVLPRSVLIASCWFFQFARLEDARAAQSLNGQLEIAGRTIKVCFESTIPCSKNVHVF